MGQTHLQTHTCTTHHGFGLATVAFSMFSMKMYQVDSVNCWSVLQWETLVVGYMGQEAAVSAGGYGPNSTNN